MPCYDLNEIYRKDVMAEARRKRREEWVDRLCEYLRVSALYILSAAVALIWALVFSVVYFLYRYISMLN